MRLVLQNFDVKSGPYEAECWIDLGLACRVLFDWPLWKRATDLETVDFEVKGSGVFELEILGKNCARRLIFTANQKVPLTALLDVFEEKVSFELRSHGSCTVETARLWGEAEGRHPAFLALVTVSHNRPEALRRRESLFADYRDLAPLGGQSLPIIFDQDEETLANLGGAGGFARGWLKAQAIGATHLLIMDDDAECDLETLHRAHVFASFAKDGAVSLAGIMATCEDPLRIWEAGARFTRFCKGAARGARLDDMAGLRRIGALEGAGVYGGWWLFMAPMAALKTGPFPLFLRGDDIGLSLSNQLKIEVLTGVYVTHPSFIERETPQSLYFDLRGHLLTHLVFTELNVQGFKSAWVGALFVLRALARFRYLEAEALLTAWQEVLQGPEQLALSPQKWENEQGSCKEILTRAQKNAGILQKIWAMLTINGHLLPAGFAHKTLTPQDLREMDAVWGSRALNVKGRVFELNRCAFWPLFLRLLILYFSYGFGFWRLRRSYRQAYPQMTSAAAWRARLDEADARLKVTLREDVACLETAA